MYLFYDFLAKCIWNCFMVGATLTSWVNYGEELIFVRYVIFCT